MGHYMRQTALKNYLNVSETEPDKEVEQFKGDNIKLTFKKIIRG